MSKLEWLKKDILAAGGMTSGITMSGLYDACGYKRLGKHVPAAVSQKLRDAGIGHIPTVLPQKHICVRVYLLASPVGQIIESLLAPNEEHDEELLSVFDGGAVKKLAQIREMILGSSEAAE